MNSNRYDQCFKNQKIQENKSIFQYVTNNSMYVNKNECLDDTPPFQAYIHRGIQDTPIAVDIENDLRRMNRPITKCNQCKYKPQDNNTINNIGPLNPNNKLLCNNDQKILPSSYDKT